MQPMSHKSRVTFQNLQFVVIFKDILSLYKFVKICFMAQNVFRISEGEVQ